MYLSLLGMQAAVDRHRSSIQQQERATEAAAAAASAARQVGHAICLAEFKEHVGRSSDELTTGQGYL